VRTQILGTKDGARKEIAKVDYRLRKRNEVWKIIDVTIDNVSLMGNFRSQFQDIMTSEPIPENATVAAVATATDKGLLIAVLLIVLLGVGGMLYLV